MQAWRRLKFHPTAFLLLQQCLPQSQPGGSILYTQTLTPESDPFLVYELGILVRLTTVSFAKQTGAMTSKILLSQASQSPEVRG